MKKVEIITPENTPLKQDEWHAASNDWRVTRFVITDQLTEATLPILDFMIYRLYETDTFRWQ